MTAPELTIDVCCDDCSCSFEIDGGTIRRGTRDCLRCPICGSNVLHVALEHAQDDWDGTLEQRAKQAVKGELADKDDVKDAFLESCPDEQLK